MTPIVSVIVSNYNNRDYIQDAVNSALSQSLREIEVVVVDDCSTDDSYEIVTKMAEKDSRLRVFQTSANQGPSAARNRCITEARGKWIAVLDGDDVYHRDRLSKLIASAEQDNADIVADDLVIFRHNPDDLLSWKQIVPSPGRIGVDEPFWVDPIAYPESNSFYTKAKPLGYLKPVIKADLLRDTQ